MMWHAVCNAVELVLMLATIGLMTAMMVGLFTMGVTM